MLQETWPRFLDEIDSDAKRAGNEFCVFAMKFFVAIKPKFLRSFEAQEQEDVKQEIVLHCIAHDFRVLRQYKPIEKGFGSWFYVIAYNKAMDILRKSGRSIKFTDFDLDEQGLNSSGNSVRVASPEPAVQSKSLLNLVNESIRLLDKYCQLLLRLAGEEYTPAEMVRVLRWPAKKSKKVSDDLRYCREKLRKSLRERGLSDY